MYVPTCGRTGDTEYTYICILNYVEGH
jgi:hypothetical protein